MAGGGVAIWLCFCVPAYLLDGERGALMCSVAAALCLVPAIASFGLCKAFGGSPELRLLAALGSTVLRMAFVLAVGMVLFFTVEEFQLGRFWVWIVVLYLATLTLEVVLIVRDANAAAELTNKTDIPRRLG
jgi:hypothetical protein